MDVKATALMLALAISWAPSAAAETPATDATGFFGAPLMLWTLAVAVLLYGLGAPAWLWIIFGAAAVISNVVPLRRVLSLGVMKTMKALKLLPVISRTEKEAIDAGTVWVEAELFSGRPDFRRLLRQSYPELTDKEQAFLDGPVRLNRLAAAPSDALGSRVAKALQVPGEQRDRLTGGVYLPAGRKTAVGRLENAFVLAYQAEDVVKKLKQAIRSRRLPKAHPLELVDEAVEKGIFTGDDRELLRIAEAARDDAVQVDSFTLEEYLQSAVLPPSEGTETPAATGAETVLA